MKTLFVGIPSHNKDLVVADNLCDAPSLFDFDAVVVDPNATWPVDFRDKLDSEYHIKVHSKEFQPLNSPVSAKREEAKHLLAKGGIIVCLLQPRILVSHDYYVQRKGEQTGYLSSYDWIPIDGLRFHVTAGEGKRIRKERSTPFDEYLGLKEIVWHAYLGKEKYPQISYETIAVNDAGLAVAATLKVDQGSVYLLPTADHEKLAEILLSGVAKALKVRVERPLPGWLKGFRVPGEEPLEQKLRGLSEQISRLKSEEESVARQLGENTFIKKLLYEQGDSLHEAVKAAFGELGFKVEREGDKDLVADNKTGRVIFEVTGSEGAIDVDKLRQLLDYVQTEEKETGITPKSILVGNHQIDIPPEKRGAPFTDRVIRQSKVFGTCLLPTTELFKAMVLSRQDKLAPKKFWDALLSRDEIFVVDDALVS